MNNNKHNKLEWESKKKIYDLAPFPTAITLEQQLHLLHFQSLCSCTIPLADRYRQGYDLRKYRRYVQLLATFSFRDGRKAAENNWKNQYETQYVLCWMGIYRGEGSEFPGIRSIPCAVDNLLLGVGTHLQWIANRIHQTLFNLVDFVPDAD